MTTLRIALGIFIGFVLGLLVVAALRQVIGPVELLLLAVVCCGIGGWLAYRSAKRRALSPPSVR